MMQENPLSADQMTAVLEDVPVAILVSSVDDWAPVSYTHLLRIGKR